MEIWFRHACEVPTGNLRLVLLEQPFVVYYSDICAGWTSTRTMLSCMETRRTSSQRSRPSPLLRLRPRQQQHQHQQPVRPAPSLVSEAQLILFSSCSRTELCSEARWTRQRRYGRVSFRKHSSSLPLRRCSSLAAYGIDASTAIKAEEPEDGGVEEEDDEDESDEDDDIIITTQSRGIDLRYVLFSRVKAQAYIR